MMGRSTCEKVREQIHGYRLGEGSPLERTLIEAHLEKCTACTNEVWLHFEMDRAARVGPESLTDIDKQRMLTRIHAAIDASDVASGEIESGYGWWGWLAVPAAVAALLLAVLWPDQPVVETVPTIATAQPAIEPVAEPAVMPTVAVSVAPGVVAYRSPVSRVVVKGSAMKPRVELKTGEFVARYERRPGQAPLEIVTPHATIIVRGTIFVVRTSDVGTVVAVERGKVEVRSSTGDMAMVEAGSAIETGAAGFQKQTLSPQLAATMQDLFGVGPRVVETSGLSVEQKAAPAGLRPARYPRVRKPRLNKEPRVVKVEEPRLEPPQSAPVTVSELLQSARVLWRSGETQEALRALDDLLRGEVAASVTAFERDEAQYLQATIYRSLGETRRAAQLLRVLAGQDGAPNARIAQLELARLLAHDLGDHEEAIVRFEQFVQTGSGDVMAEQATFELCVLLIEDEQRERAARCLTGFLESFGEARLADAARGFLDRLKASADVESAQ